MHPRSTPAHITSLVLAACAASLAGCAAGDDTAEGFVVRDSAGVRIVETTAAAWDEGETWRIAAEPTVDIGVLNGAREHQLYDVRGAARFDNGRIAVANAGSGEIRIYDAEGEFLRALGGTGEGPGEFARLTAMLVTPGDTVVAFDRANDRVTVFGPDGGLVRTVQLDRHTSGNLLELARLADGSVIAAPAWSSARLDPDDRGDGVIHRMPTPIVRFAADGALADSIGVWPGGEVATWDVGGRMAMGSPVFARRLVHAVHDGRVYVGTQEIFEIAVHALDGSLERLIRWPRRDLTVTEQDIATVRDRMAERLPSDDPAVVRRFEQMFAARPVAESRPAYGTLRVDADGNLWVADGGIPAGAPPERWTVFDADGRMLGTVDVPHPIGIFEIGEDYVLGTATDEYDVEHVRLYRLSQDG